MRMEIDTLMSEHQRIRAMMKHFLRQLDQFGRAERPDYDILNGSIAYCSEYLDRWHHPKEDALLELLSSRLPSVKLQMDELTEQHEHLATSTQEIIRIFTDVVDRGGIYVRDDLVRQGRSMCAAYEDHLAWEEEHFFPVAERKLTQEDWSAFAEQFEVVSDPLATNPVDRRYSVLFSAISGD